MQRKIKVLSVCGVGLLSAVMAYFLLLPANALAEIPLLAMDGQKIVIASTVRFREQPSLEAKVLGHVGLGAVLRATRRTEEKIQTGELEGYWYLIQAGDTEDKKGWISGRFLRDFKTEEKEKIWFSMLRERMDNPDLSFADRVALYRFADVVADKTAGKDESDDATIDSDKLDSAFALGRLLALQKAFDGVNGGNVQQEPYKSWAKEHEEAQRVFRDEISGQWLVPSKNYWELADQYKEQRGGDEISWYAANAQLGGECEGDIECNLNREKITYGEYLKRYPYGRYAGKALQRMSATFEYMQQELEREPDYFRNSRSSGDVIEALFEIVANVNPKLSERAVAFKQIKAIRLAFRQQ